MGSYINTDFFKKVIDGIVTRYHAVFRFVYRLFITRFLFFA